MCQWVIVNGLKIWEIKWGYWSEGRKWEIENINQSIGSCTQIGRREKNTIKVWIPTDNAIRMSEFWFIFFARIIGIEKSDYWGITGNNRKLSYDYLQIREGIQIF